MYPVILTIHVLSATIWTGGHLVLSLAILPAALRRRDVQLLSTFEGLYERVGLPALLVQVLTGLHLAATMAPDPAMWFGFGNVVSQTVTLKLLLLAATLVVGLHARFRIVPNLTVERLPQFAAHVVLVTLLAVGFVVVGVSFRTGGLFG
jgi:putative copper export protein